MTEKESGLEQCLWKHIAESYDPQELIEINRSFEKCIRCTGSNSDLICYTPLVNFIKYKKELNNYLSD